MYSETVFAKSNVMSNKGKKAKVTEYVPTNNNYTKTINQFLNTTEYELNNTINEVEELVLEPISDTWASIPSSNDNYTEEDILQLAKILYHEVGADSAVNPDDNFFMRLNTASIILNNASRKSGNSWYEKLYNLTDGNYNGYSNYKNSSFDSVVGAKREEMLYIAELVLSGRYTLPSNMTLQATAGIVNKYGNEWSSIDNKSGFYDVSLGYEGSSLSSTDAFGKTIENNSVEYYKELANSLKLEDYSNFTVESIGSMKNTGTKISYQPNANINKI